MFELFIKLNAWYASINTKKNVNLNLVYYLPHLYYFNVFRISRRWLRLPPPPSSPGLIWLSRSKICKSKTRKAGIKCAYLVRLSFWFRQFSWIWKQNSPLFLITFNFPLHFSQCKFSPHILQAVVTLQTIHTLLTLITKITNCCSSNNYTGCCHYSDR